jgi:hypothetical protein
MKSSSFAVATVVLLAANCLSTCPNVLALQQENAAGKPCATDQPGCAQPAAGAATATSAPAPSSPAPSSAVAAAEKPTFHILAEFSGGLNVKKLKPGDKITAQVSQDVLWHGKIIIPEESKLVGHVTEVQRRSADGPESRLGLVFDRVLLKHHHEIDFQGVVQALSPPAPRRSKVDEPDQMLPPASMTVSQSSGMGAMGGTSAASRSSTSTVTTKTMSLATMPAGVPVYVDGSPGSNPGNSVGADLKHNGASQPAGDSKQQMSVGMPRGVFGIKGLTLSPGPSSSTPGPVILSTVTDVKLENGTQVLLSIINPTVRQQ